MYFFVFFAGVSHNNPEKSTPKQYKYPSVHALYPDAQLGTLYPRVDFRDPVNLGPFFFSVLCISNPDGKLDALLLPVIVIVTVAFTIIP